MSRGALDAIFTRILDDGEEKELQGGLNFIGLTVTEDPVNGWISVEFSGGAGTSAGADGVLQVSDGAGGFEAAVLSVDADEILLGSVRLVQFSATDTTWGSATAGSRYYDAAVFHAWRATGSFTVLAVLSTTKLELSVPIDLNSLGLSEAGAVAGVTLLNAAAPLAPVEGTVLADANANIVATDGSQIRIPTLTANRTYDINNTSAIDEEFIFLYRTGTEAFTATIRDNGDATIATFPVSTKLVGAFQKEVGGNFAFRGFQRLA